MEVGILVYENCSLWAASGVMEMLLRANTAQKYYHGKKAEQRFHIQFVSASKKTINTQYQITINHHTNIYANKSYDLIIIPGIDSSPLMAIEQNKEAINWLKQQASNKTQIASICTGSFLLAATGLLNNKPATTHWFMADIFKKTFPDIILKSEKIIIDNGNTFMSGGATSFQNLILYIIEKYLGRKVAIGVSKLYLIDINKDNQNSYSILNFQKNHQDESILLAQSFIESNYNEKISIQDIADKISMSKRNFIRRFKTATGDTPFKYIQKIRIEIAKRIIESERKSFGEIAYQVGYEDVNAFRKIFVENTGITPSAYKKKFSISYS